VNVDGSTGALLWRCEIAIDEAEKGSAEIFPGIPCVQHNAPEEMPKQ
jgi:hypothetical protein